MKRFGLIMAALLLFSTINFAQDDEEYTGFMLGPELGYYKAKDADNGETLFGVQARLRFNKFFGIEGAIDYRQEDYMDGDVKVKTYPVQATALIFPIPIVYGAIGAGWYNTKIEYDSGLFDDDDFDADKTSQEFGYHFGGGVQVPLNEKVAISGDIRYVFLNYDFDEVPGEDVDANFYVIKASILFKL